VGAIACFDYDRSHWGGGRWADVMRHPIGLMIVWTRSDWL
jgi:hypothetical protein